MNKSDVLVIGSGAAGVTVATQCAAAGLDVAIVDHRPYGGTCKLRGCDPKKVLLAASEAVARVEPLVGRGLRGETRVDWPKLMARKRSFIEGMSAGTEASLDGAGVKTLHGTARFLDAQVLDIDGERWLADHFVIAAGARPRPLRIPGEELLATSEAFMDLDELPGRIVFVGGGYISFEFAALARTAGANVTILHRSARPLKGFDGALALQLVERYRELGIDVLLERTVRAVKRSGDTLSVETGSEELAADLAVHGAGRVADLDDLDLAAAAVQSDGRGVVVDEHLRSVTNPRVFAAGDAAAVGQPLTPVASRQGLVVAGSIVGQPVVYDPRSVASVAFSDPPLASVGMSTDEAADREDVEVVANDMSAWFTNRRIGLSHAGARVVREKRAGRLLGAHLLSAHADEVINLFALAIRHGLTSDEVAETVWAYPTGSSDVNYLL